MGPLNGHEVWGNYRVVQTRKQSICHVKRAEREYFSRQGGRRRVEHGNTVAKQSYYGVLLPSNHCYIPVSITISNLLCSIRPEWLMKNSNYANYPFPFSLSPHIKAPAAPTIAPAPIAYMTPVHPVALGAAPPLTTKPPAPVAVPLPYCVQMPVCNP
jgi:hypothetical protein